MACATSASCATQFVATTCTGTEVVRLCAQPADCTETGDPKCCTFSENGGMLSFCANSIVAASAGATCM